MTITWSPDSWRHKPAAQQPPWPDGGALDRALKHLGSLPPLVFAGEARNLTAHLAEVAEELARPAPVGVVADESARNRMRGIVTRVLKDTVMAQVELQCGPFRVVSLMSREAVDDLGLEVGSVAVASIKSTNVVVGVPQ